MARHLPLLCFVPPIGLVQCARCKGSFCMQRAFLAFWILLLSFSRHKYLPLYNELERANCRRDVEARGQVWP
ncbi:hypothetical protein PLICRDRAFT_623215 [Plicaturopsis crispa FD-325 SS-3]|nr:hypothetical protein PLICRDRAFT_623215 [Plicaturopsis crispa FD-325 SS-3]